jgi:diguanylate cyclase (GGDEF)-like protein
LASTKLHKLVERQLKKISPERQNALREDAEFLKFVNLISTSYHEYDEHVYTLERSLEVSYGELQLLQERQKSSYESHINAMVSAMPDMMFLNNEEGIFLEAFKEKGSLCDAEVEIVGKSYEEIFPQKIAKFFKDNFKKALSKKRLHVAEFMVDETKESYEARFLSEESLIDGKKTVLSIVRNITKDKKNQEKLEYLAKHDSLTKLPNRFYFQKRLQELLKQPTTQEQGGLFFLDIDHFKTINDNLGHEVGDKILVRITKRLKNALSKDAFLARFGGDEFVLIVNNATEEALASIASDILKQFVRPFKIDKYLLELTTSIGICTFPDRGSTPTQLIKQADIAMYHAKESGRNQFSFFTKELAEQAYQEFLLEVNLKKAIDNNEFYLVYQPQISLQEKKIIGLEALIRWEYEGLVPPSKFIPLAEQCGFIEHISDWVVEEVCKQILVWKNEGVLFPPVAINLSRKEIGKANLLSRINKITHKYHVESSLLEFEVTETALMENKEIAFKNMMALRTDGYLVAIDDFGIGYSSLSNLKEFFFDKLKIDRSFVSGIGYVKESELIIQAIIAMAHSLKLKVIAEGVETKEHFDFLTENSCDQVQGYYCSYPLRGEEVNAFALASF